MKGQSTGSLEFDSLFRKVKEVILRSSDVSPEITNLYRSLISNWEDRHPHKWGNFEV